MKNTQDNQKEKYWGLLTVAVKVQQRGLGSRLMQQESACWAKSPHNLTHFSSSNLHTWPILTFSWAKFGFWSHSYVYNQIWSPFLILLFNTICHPTDLLSSHQLANFANSFALLFSILSCLPIISPTMPPWLMLKINGANNRWRSCLWGRVATLPKFSPWISGHNLWAGFHGIITSSRGWRPGVR